jgi:hypothetical protein
VDPIGTRDRRLPSTSSRIAGGLASRPRGSSGMSTFAINEDRPPSTPILLSSDAFVERDRFDAWREELMLKVMCVDVDVPDRMKFRTRVRVLNLPNVAIIERRSTPSVVKHTAELVPVGDDALVFSLPWRRNVESRTAVGQARVRAGEAIIHALNDVTSSRAPEGFLQAINDRSPPGAARLRTSARRTKIRKHACVTVKTRKDVSP